MASTLTDQLPGFFDQLDLTDEQREQLKEAVREHHHKLAVNWAKFHTLHMQAIALEAALLATVEDTMTEEQREQFRQALRERMQPRLHRAARIERNDEPPVQPDQPQPADPAEIPAPADADEQPVQPQRPEPPRQPEPAEPWPDEPPRDVPPPREELDEDVRTEPEAADEEARVVRRGVLVIGIAVRSPEEDFDTAELTDEQRARFEEACAKYQAHLQPLWSQIQALHVQMVKHEVDKLAAIEEILTDEQLAQLKEMRHQPAPDDPETFIHAEEAPDTVQPPEEDNDEKEPNQ